MHMISKMDVKSAELETFTTSRSPTTIITPNGAVQTHEEAAVYVTELNIFLTMKKVFEDTPAVLSLGKLCDKHGYSLRVDSTLQNHISLKTVFGYSATRRTSTRSWCLVFQRVLPSVFPLQHP